MMRLTKAWLTGILWMLMGLDAQGSPQAGSSAFKVDTSRVDSVMTQRIARLNREENRAFLWSECGMILPLIFIVGISTVPDVGDEYALPLGVLGVSAVTVGPSLGQFKAGSIGHGLAATAVRALGEAIALGALASALCMMCDEEEAASRPNPTVGIVVGASLYVAGIVYSLKNLHSTYETKRRETRAAFTLMPILKFDSEFHPSPGMMAVLEF